MGGCFQRATRGYQRSKKLVEAGGFALQDLLARRYNYRGPFDPALLRDIDNPYRLALLIETIKDGDPDDRRMVNLSKYMKSLLNVHGVAMCRAQGWKIDNIFTEDAKQETKKGRTVRHTFTMADGTVVKVMANG